MSMEDRLKEVEDILARVVQMSLEFRESLQKSGEEHDRKLSAVNATLDRAARMYDKMVVRQVGIRNMYRQGLRRFSDMSDRIDHQDKLLEALIDSQLRTERQLSESHQRLEKQLSESHQRLEKQLSESHQRLEKQLAESHQRLEQSQKELSESLKRLSDTFQAYLHLQKK